MTTPPSVVHSLLSEDQFESGGDSYITGEGPYISARVSGQEATGSGIAKFKNLNLKCHVYTNNSQAQSMGGSYLQGVARKQ